MFRSLKFRFFLAFVGLAVGPLLLAALLVGNAIKDEETWHSRVILQATAERVRDGVRSLFEASRRDVQVIDNMIGIGLRADTRRYQVLQALLLRNKTFQTLRIIDLEGGTADVVSRSNMQPGLHSRLFRDRKGMASAIETGQPLFGGVRMDESLNEPLITMLIPLQMPITGQVECVMVADLRFKAVWDLLAHLTLGPGTQAYIVDEEGVVVAHRNPTHALQRKEAPVGEIGLAGAPVLRVRMPLGLAGAGLLVVVEQDLADAEVTIRRILNVSTITAVFFILVALLFFTYFVLRMVFPLERLVAASKQVGRGQTPETISVAATGEVRELIVAFNQMATDIAKARDLASLHAMELANKNLKLDADNLALERAEASLRQALDKVTLSNEELEQFAYVASHDLKEPLRMVGSYLQLLKMRYADQLDDTASEYIGFAVDGALRMNHLITDLLEYSRVETKGGELIPLPMENILQVAMQDLSVTIDEKGATVKVEGQWPVCEVDGSQIVRLFENLIGNALKYADEDRAPEVVVSGALQGDQWVFSVADNGIGIAEEFHARIFAIFQRLHNHDAYGGTGIGLAVAKKIVERHGGRIWVESCLGKGTTFYFSLPQAAAPE
ncbi:ATP-binding protein [Magnetospira sp. QH-2]|uniref:sensor histidine kinase n=1 Tax=Magnetospira sp. (strain QH-2) TaxID=1288970 RepID=UPI0003E80DBD|nr:ATP-binding protein [Magnetospira sp. QH-2]CCQ73658.1 Putative Histidine kinase [Magnetospira sp. QH-2]